VPAAATSLLKSIAFTAAAGYAGIAGMLWLSQESMLFYPQPPAGKPGAPRGWSLEDVRITARDGTRLAGVLVKPGTQASVDRAPLVIFYGGNAEEVTVSARGANAYGARAFLLVNYRGYGESQGRPSEAALVSDALELYDWAARRPDIDPERIALYGRSLGTGVAVQVAAARRAKCMVLVSPLDSVRDVAQAIYPWLPVSLLLRHPFDSMVHAPNLRMPALVIIAEADRVIAPKHSERLARAWGGPVERVGFPGLDHNDLEIDEKYFQSIAKFLDKHL